MINYFFINFMSSLIYINTLKKGDIKDIKDVDRTR